jgi:RNA polymerase sigma-70 factor (ECF subfamily)
MTASHTEIWFKEVFNCHYERLRNYLYYLSGDIAWSEDAVQEVFLILWNKRHFIDDQTIAPYLFRVSRNLFLKQKRHEEVVLRFLKDHPEREPENTVTSEIEMNEFDLRLQTALSGLPSGCRTVFLMSRMEEMSNKQIAENLAISLKAVEKQITKALKILRVKLEDREV